MDQNISTNEIEEKIAQKEEVIQHLTRRAGGCKEFYRKYYSEHWKWNYYYRDERYDHLYQ